MADGVEWLNVFAVDNVLQRIADPCFVGAVIANQCEVGEKVVRKCAPDEKIGVVCLEDGRPSIVEYYELTQELMDAKDAKGDPAYYFGLPRHPGRSSCQKDCCGQTPQTTAP